MKPTLEEVKEYFKNAKEVKGTCELFGVIDINKIYEGFTGCICCKSDIGAIILYDSHTNKFAEIISYKDEQVGNS